MDVQNTQVRDRHEKVSQLQRVTDMSHVFENTHARDSQGSTSWLLKNETKNQQNRGRNLPETTQRIRLRKRKGNVRGDHVHEDTYPTSYTVFGKLKDEFPQKYQKTV